MVKKEFINRLKSLNYDLFKECYFIDLYVAGGMAIAFNIDETRATLDIDVFNNDLQKKVIRILNDYDINTEISNIVKDKSYLNHVYKHDLSESLSNINLYICNNSYLFVLKNMAIISPFRTYEDKLVDHEDIKMLYKYINHHEVYKIISELYPKTINEEDKRYLTMEVEKWMKIN